MTIPAAVSDASSMRQRVKHHLSANELDAAQATLEAYLARAPNDTAAALELAELMHKAGQWRASSQPLLEAAQHLPRHAPLVLALEQALAKRGEIVAARRCLDFLGQVPEPPAHLLLAQAHLRFGLGEIEQARELVERALRAGADDPDDHFLHAMLLQFTGELERACEVLVQCLGRWPGYGDAAVVLANLHKHAHDFDLLAHVERQLAALPAPAGDANRMFVRAHFEYARFKLLDGGERDGDAWASLARCNALMRQINPYDAEGTAATTDALIAASTQWAAVEPAPSADTGPTPIFIVGMPRSGTTLLDRMLSCHSEIASAGELTDFWQQLHWVANVGPLGTGGLRDVAMRSKDMDFAEVGARYLQHTRWRAGDKRFYIDKLPANIQVVGFIRRALPHTRIIHIERPAMDVCYSNLKAMFGNVSSYSYEQAALAHYYQQYSRLVQHWRAHFAGAMLEVSYASLVNASGATLGAILSHCGLAMEDACLHPERNRAPVATPSNAQVREAIHGGAHDRWRVHAQELQPLRQLLGEAAAGSA